MSDPTSKNGELINNYIKEGKIVPMEITIELVKNAMIKQEQSKLFLLDGFPRQLDQAEKFEETVLFVNKVCKSRGVLFYDCNEQIMCERLLERGKSSGRSDDNMESIKKRFVTYKEATLPVIEYFEKMNKVFKVKHFKRSTVMTLSIGFIKRPKELYKTF
jgi:UMP-CMP kinase